MSRISTSTVSTLLYLTGQQPDSARDAFFYFNDDGDLVAMRYDNWKTVFEEQRAKGTMQIWPSHSLPCAFRRSSTCGPTPMSAPISRQTPITIG
jgi:hypothetical protein